MKNKKGKYSVREVKETGRGRMMKKESKNRIQDTGSK